VSSEESSNSRNCKGHNAIVKHALRWKAERMWRKPFPKPIRREHIARTGTKEAR